MTDAGPVRPHNEDAFVDSPGTGLWAVADGAGGHTAGDLASSMLAEALAQVPAALGPEEALAQIRLAVLAVHSALREEALARGQAMIASTLVVLLLRGAHFAVLWAGDSRVYLLRRGCLTRLTHDHSLVQALVDSGTISEDAAEHHPMANVITRAIGGAEDSGELDKVIGAAEAGDRFLLCSDGLTKAMGEADIARLMLDGDPARALVTAALAHATRDNVTAVVVALEAAA